MPIDALEMNAAWMSRLKLMRNVATAARFTDGGGQNRTRALTLDGYALVPRWTPRTLCGAQLRHQFTGLAA
jgi:hypothetical protein